MKFDGSKITLSHEDYYPLVIQQSSLNKDGQVFLIPNIQTMDETVISASRNLEKRKDVAQKVQVMRAKEIQFQNQSSTADLVTQTGNVFVQKSQLGGGSPIIRGFETNKVLLVVDGVRMNNAIYRLRFGTTSKPMAFLQCQFQSHNKIVDSFESAFYPELECCCFYHKWRGQPKALTVVLVCKIQRR